MEVNPLKFSASVSTFRSGALQSGSSLREGAVPPAPPPQRQPGGPLRPQQPAEPQPLPVHPQPPGGLLHPPAAGRKHQQATLLGLKTSGNMRGRSFSSTSLFSQLEVPLLYNSSFLILPEKTKLGTFIHSF